MTNIEHLLHDLCSASKSSDVERTIRELLEVAEKDMKNVVALAVKNVRTGEFDGSKWSSLALTMLDVFKDSEEPGEILKALVELDEENGGYLNNFGVYMEMRGRIAEAIEYYARAYATDYKYHGHEKAMSFPAWTNLHRIASGIVSKSVRKMEG